MFLERIRDTGMRGNRYWYNKAWNKGASTVNGLPNCTCFCVGETYEATEVGSPFQMFKSPYNNPGAFPTAKNWYSLWNGKKGIEPKIGGVAVWGGTKGDGHVAYVLETKDVGTKGAWMKVCQSNFGGKYFEVKEYTVKKGVITPGIGYPYIGCCYNTINDKRVARNKDLLQVEVIADELNVRQSPGGTVYFGRVCPKGIYTVLDTQKKDGYTWAKIDENAWIALNDADKWTITYTLDPTEMWKVAYEKLSQQYSDLLLAYERDTGHKYVG